MSAYQKSNMGRLVLIGGLIGASLSLFSKGTRTTWQGYLSSATKNSGKLIYTLWKKPDQVTNYLKATTSHVKMMAREVSQDFQEMVNKVDQARTSSTDAYRYAMEAGDEITQIASKLRTTSKSVMDFQQPTLIGTTSSTSGAANSSQGTASKPASQAAPSPTNYLAESSAGLAEAPAPTLGSPSSGAWESSSSTSKGLNKSKKTNTQNSTPPSGAAYTVSKKDTEPWPSYESFKSDVQPDVQAENITNSSASDSLKSK
ncbi:hypothetical protein QS257_05455 [Terrilactibacillus sp. S3-3]|nr:hypothetical protein QS257_05455 [Terrilactibacillus sp. S3-3]